MVCHFSVIGGNAKGEETSSDRQDREMKIKKKSVLLKRITGSRPCFRQKRIGGKKISWLTSRKFGGKCLPLSRRHDYFRRQIRFPSKRGYTRYRRFHDPMQLVRVVLLGSLDEV